MQQRAGTGSPDVFIPVGVYIRLHSVSLSFIPSTEVDTASLLIHKVPSGQHTFASSHQTSPRRAISDPLSLIWISTEHIDPVILHRAIIFPEHPDVVS